MKQVTGLLGGLALTLALFLVMAVLLGRDARMVKESRPSVFAIRIVDLWSHREKEEKPKPSPPLPEVPKKIPEVALALRPASTPFAELQLEPPRTASFGGFSLPLSMDLPEELFRTGIQKGPGLGPDGRGADLEIYEATEVDTPPYPIRRPLPPYPEEAKRRGIEGEVRVRVLVDKRGKVVEVRVVEADPRGVFEAVVVETMKRWEFKPALKGGRPVDVWVAIPIRFELRGG